MAGLFLVIVFLQAFHSLEEYVGALWENFPPARFLCGLVSNALETGFLVINIGFFTLGLLAWFFVVRKNRPFSNYMVGFWIVIELINGIGHPVWAVMKGSYQPGLITAPLLLVTAIWLLKLQKTAAVKL